MRRALLAAALVAVAPAAATAQVGSPVPAVPTLAYVTGLDKGKPVLWAANADGTNKHVLVRGGMSPQVSPNGARVAYVTGFQNAQLRVIAAAGGTPVTVAKHVWSYDVIHWSPDSTTLTVATGPELGPYTLELVNVDTGAVRALAKGTFYGASFAPGGQGVVWSRASKDSYPLRGDLYETDLAGGPITALTSDHNDIYPAWGPTKIAYSRQRKSRHKNDAYKLDIYTINPDGSARARLTRTNPQILLAGLTPTQWSADGTRLLAEFGGQDTSEAWSVDPATGTAKDLTGKFDAVVGYALSADGSTVLARAGYVDDPKGKIVALDYASGHMTVLAANARDASWNR